MQIRRLTLEELNDPRVHSRLSAEAFGPPPPGSPTPPQLAEIPPGRHPWGVFDGGSMVAGLVALEFSSWYGSAQVPTCGIASVAVAAEYRGRGLLAPLLGEVLTEAADRGEVISTLYPTANGIYRTVGYEMICSFDTVEIPTAELTRVRRPDGTRTRRATAQDTDRITEVYAAWAAAQNGPLTRTGPRYPDAAWARDSTAETTVATTDQDHVVGFMSWDRTGGYREGARLEIGDLIATTADAYRALWSVAASFAPVTDTVSLPTSGHDPARSVLPTSTWNLVQRHPYGLRILDVEGAFGVLSPRLPGAPERSIRFRVEGDRLGFLDGTYSLALDGAGCTRVAEDTGRDMATFTPQGLALAFAGTQNSANLRMMDALRGPDEHDPVFDAVLTGRPAHVRDYF